MGLQVACLQRLNDFFIRFEYQTEGCRMFHKVDIHGPVEASRKAHIRVVNNITYDGVESEQSAKSNSTL